METLTKEKTTAAEYLEREAKAETKSEYHAGQIVAMAGAQEPHNSISSNLIFLLNRCLWLKGCKVYGSDQLLHLISCDRYVYPDISVVCQKPKLEKHRGIDALLNPILIVEVASESTEEDDKKGKFDCYLELESLETYVRVSSTAKKLWIYRRQDVKRWMLERADASDEFIELMGCKIAVEDIYRLVFE